MPYLTVLLWKNIASKILSQYINPHLLHTSDYILYIHAMPTQEKREHTWEKGFAYSLL